MEQKLNIAINELAKEVKLLNKALDKINNQIKLTEKELTKTPGFYTCLVKEDLILVKEEEDIKSFIGWGNIKNSRRILFLTEKNDKELLRKPLIEMDMQTRVEYHKYIPQLINHINESVKVWIKHNDEIQSGVKL